MSNALTPITVIRSLRKHYPPFVTALTWKTEWQLLVSVMLSAQCTDERVNRVTPVLFKALPTIEDFTTVSQVKLEKLIFSTGAIVSFVPPVMDPRLAQPIIESSKRIKKKIGVFFNVCFLE